MQSSTQNYLRRTGIEVYLVLRVCFIFCAKQLKTYMTYKLSSVFFSISFYTKCVYLKPHMVGAFEDFDRRTASPGSGEFVNI